MNEAHQIKSVRSYTFQFNNGRPGKGQLEFCFQLVVVCFVSLFAWEYPDGIEKCTKIIEALRCASVRSLET